MNILILSDRYYPAPVSGAILIKDLADELTDQKHCVTVVCGDHTITDHNISREDSVNVLRVKVANQKALNKANRLIFELSLQYKMWKVYKNELKNAQFDIVIAHSPTIFWSFIISRINNIKKIPTYLILRDLFPQWTLDSGELSRLNPVYWVLRYFELRLYKNSDLIGLQSERDIKYISNLKDRLNFETEVLFNWQKKPQQQPMKSNIRKDLDLLDKVIFIFGGNIGIAQNIKGLMRVIDEFEKNQNIHFLFIGAGTEYETLNKWLTENSKKNVTLMPSVTNDEYQAILVECDVGIVSLRKDIVTNNYPNKMLNYMRYKLPILATLNIDIELHDFINKHEIGLVSDNGDDKSLIKNINFLAKNKEEREKMGLNGFFLLEKEFNSKSAVKKILKFYEDEVKKHPNLPN